MVRIIRFHQDGLLAYQSVLGCEDDAAGEEATLSHQDIKQSSH